MSQAVQESNINAPSDREVAYRQSMSRLNDLLRNGLSISGRERNCCFLNSQTARFANVSSAVGLDSIGDGRAYGLVDWDHDGDLDLWATSRTSPRVRFLRNNSDGNKHFVKLMLEGNGKTTNRDAIGARVEIVMRESRRHKSIKTLHAGDGFLSQSSKWLHFGLGDLEQIDHVEVRWPGGEVEKFSGLQAGEHYRLVQGSGVVQPWSRPGPVQHWQASQTRPLKSTDQATIHLRNRIPLPALHYNTLDGDRVALEKYRGSPTLVNLWASWCQPCLRELSDFRQHHDRLADTGLKIVALSVDELAEDKSANAEAARTVVEKQQFPFGTGVATEELVGNLETVLLFLFEHRRPWAVPTSFLLDAQGRLSVIYVGRVEIEELIADVNKLEFGDQQWLRAALPLEGSWSGAVGSPDLALLVKKLHDEGYKDSAVNYFEQFGTLLRRSSLLPKLIVRLGVYLRDESERPEDAIEFFRRAVEAGPNFFNAHFELASEYESLKQWPDALRHFQRSVEANPDWASSRIQLALTLNRLNRSDEAIPHLQKATQIDPTLAGPHYHLAAIFLESGQLEEATEQFRKAYELEPDNLATINGLAWTLAIKPESDNQETAEAVRLAEEAAELTKHRNPQILDTLGAAYAADGKFDKAVKTAERAVELATKSGSTELAAELRGRLKQYRRKHPARETHSR